MSTSLTNEYSKTAERLRAQAGQGGSTLRIHVAQKVNDSWQHFLWITPEGAPISTLRMLREIKRDNKRSEFKFVLWATHLRTAHSDLLPHEDITHLVKQKGE